MNYDNLKILGIETVKTTAAIVAVDALSIKSRVIAFAPNNKIGAYGAVGVADALASNLVNMVTHGSSKFQRGDWYGILDDVIFFSSVSAISNESRAVDGVFNLISSVAPFEEDFNIQIAEASVVAAASLVANALDVGTGVNLAFDFIRRPVTTTMAMYA